MGAFEGDARLVESPFGRAASLDGTDDSVVIPHSDEWNLGSGDFTVAAWIRPKQLRNSAIAVYGAFDQEPGWRLELATGRGAFRMAIAGQDDPEGEAVTSPNRVIRKGEWQHVAAVVKREGETVLYVNGYAVAKGELSAANLDNPKANLRLGRVSYDRFFNGDLDELRIYTRAIGEAEIQALIEPGRQLVKAPPATEQDVNLTLGGRPFGGTLNHPTWAAVRLDAGELEVGITHTGMRGLERVVLTRLDESHAVSKRFLAFEKREPRLGVYLGIRRDCGSTLVPVGPPQTVSSEGLQKFTFEGAISDFPRPEVEKNNVNYLAGIHEFGVRSEYTDGRDMPRLMIRSVEFEGPLYETWPPETHQAIFVESDRKHDAPAYAREILRNFAEKAYRRPITDQEETALMGVFQRSLDAGDGFQKAVKDALLVTLTSPQFLFMVETSETPEPEEISEHELASKLSYFLWNEPPDQKTLELADQGRLRERMDEEVERLIKDQRFSQFANEFTSQWLNLDKFDVLEPDRERFPRLSRDVRANLRREPIEFVKYLIRNNLPARNLVASDFIMANEVVADYYDLGDRTESGFEFVPIVHGRPELGGVLTQAALMAGLSDGRESNPVKRGAWIARKIVAEPPDDPPPNVPDLAADTEGLSLRERIEQHRSQPGCMQCHTKIDPWGVALQDFDAGGRLKEQKADSQSTLPDGTKVADANELKEYLAEDHIDQVAFSVLMHLQVYANGRSLSYNEMNFLKQDALRLRENEYRMQDMIRYVVNSKMFLEK